MIFLLIDQTEVEFYQFPDLPVSRIRPYANPRKRQNIHINRVSTPRLSHEFALVTPSEWEVEKGAFRQNYCPLSGHEFFEVSACAPIYGEVSASESECTHACICATFVVSVDSLDLDEMGKRRGEERTERGELFTK